jgi:hypothetical protein
VNNVEASAARQRFANHVHVDIEVRREQCNQGVDVSAEQLGDKVDVLRRARNAVDRARYRTADDVADTELVERFRDCAHDDERISEHGLVTLAVRIPAKRSPHRLRIEAPRRQAQRLLSHIGVGMAALYVDDCELLNRLRQRADASHLLGDSHAPVPGDQEGLDRRMRVVWDHAESLPSPSASRAAWANLSCGPVRARKGLG